MELKLFHDLAVWGEILLVLIVPLWNWNKTDTGLLQRGNKGSNRTFMELK